MSTATTCKACGKNFSLSEGERSWYLSHNLELPKRCLECRKRRAEKRKMVNEQIRKDSEFAFFASMMQAGVNMRRSTKINTDGYRGYFNYQRIWAI